MVGIAMPPSPIATRIWEMKYRLSTADGVVDKTIDETWRRVAEALAANEREPALWTPRFFEALRDHKFLPAGRILAGAGSGRDVTLFNCFVMGAVPDDMAGIFEHLKEAALTMQRGGGIGYDFSTLRPCGAPVLGVGADASGPLSFMDVWDAMCRTIMSAGSRRGAMMATLRCDHPDIEDFVDAKRDARRLRNFNLSVLVSDAFMAAVTADGDWPLVFGGRTFRTVRARALWDRIMRATYEVAEPGVIFIDRINRANNLAYCESISATNPCVTADTWIQTVEGARQVSELVGRPATLLVNGTPHDTTAQGFFATGHKPVVRLTTVEGYQLRLTADHLVCVVSSQTRWRQETTWRAAGELTADDRVVLHDHRAIIEWSGEFDADRGYLLGLLVGDGTLKSDKAVLSVWSRTAAVNDGCADPDAVSIMDAALSAARRLPHRADFSGWMAVEGRQEFRLATGAVRQLAVDVGMSPGNKAITARMERASSDFYRGFLRGFFDCDGTVIGSQAKGVSVRLAQSDLPRLEAVQRMLLRLGIVSTIYTQRRAAGTRSLPDGRGGLKDYAIKAQHELVVAGDNVQRFAEVVGFTHASKAIRLKALVSAYRRQPNRERFIARVASVQADGVETVFDASVPGVNAFDANGIVVHNCGEQPLPPYGACLLGSINLARLVKDPFEESAALDMAALEALVPLAVRMLDNAIDVSRFPLPAQKEEAQAKRRMGLGVTGLADALIMCGVRYGSPEALRLTEEWLAAVRRQSYLASSDLSAEKGSFPLFNRNRYLAGETVSALDSDVRDSIARYGMRNALLNSIAPTGTISLLADNVSSGIEPVFAFTYERAVTMPDGSRRSEEVADYAYRLFRHLEGPEVALPDAFVDAQTLPPAAHLAMQAAAQKYVDSSISKTINLPESISFEAFKDVYTEAYRLGCKGCTTYRPNAVTGAVLTTSAAEATPVALAPVKAPAKDGVVYIAQPLERPAELPGSTYKIKWPGSDHAIYITLNDIVQDGRRRPFEIFINSKNMEHYAWTVALTRMISAVFRRGGDVSFVVEELKAVFDPRGGQWMEGRYVPSLLAAIGAVIERHLVDIGFLAPGERPLSIDSVQLKAAVGGEPSDGGGPGASEGQRLGQCSQCGAAALTHRDGCDLCLSCGYSRCG
ncbi:LAGLIDADG family homing endonuclease [Reyranella sp. CPCC 100927]|uniref:LAGLIDADG family homing endonuclease n=1 Tax=Reyranella sp. CPCC 100927 TaxID=2599616 RepID=UPI0011B7CEA3|nr:LAGLIDADG family homing endonuclease [Reyranella sp. CPCC 100927]TWT13985.1 ribonucleoside reductase [Reyranella sp. CPCC 100927]